MTGKLFCFGLGYTARRLAAVLLAEGWQITGTTRSGAGDPGAGIAFLSFSRETPLAPVTAALAGTTHLLLSVPPDETGDPVLDRLGAEIAGIAGLRWVGYLSTTGVYGDRGGGLVDEDSPLLPTGARGRRRQAAEAGWLDLQRRYDVPIQVFRLASIYGPKRSAFEALREGRAQRIDKPSQIFSRIHVDDIVTALRASMAQPQPGRIYNLCDDEPAPPAEVIAFACQLLGMAPPPLVPFAEAVLTPMARSFYADNKRVSNARLKAELGVRLTFPSYRDGLRALLAAEPTAI